MPPHDVTKPTVEFATDRPGMGHIRIVGDVAGAYINMVSLHRHDKHQAERLAARLDANFVVLERNNA